MIELWGSLLSIFCSFLIARCYLLFCSSSFVRKMPGKRYVGVLFLFALFATIFPILTLIVLLLSGSLSSESRIWQVSLVILNLVDVAALSLFGYMERTSMEREQLIAASERARIQDENIQALSQAYSTQRKMTHDFRAHLDALSSLLEQDDMEGARSYLAELRVRTTERILLVNSHNAAIDAVLNQKSYIGKQQGIDMRFRVSDLSALRIPAADSTIVLGNLLDNAIEACAKFEQEARWIEVRLLYHTNDNPAVLLITVTNPSLPVKIRNGKIATSKKNAMLHGFGLQNVEEILNRHEAEHTLSYTDGLFSFYCSWPDPS